jgi:hypothetical protein
MTALPGTRSLRQRLGIVVVALGAWFTVSALSSSWPQEQTIAFRLADELAREPLRLEASVTRVGDVEASAGLTINRSGSETDTSRQTLRLPDGSYVVAVSWELTGGVRNAESAPKEGETSSVHRVTLSGAEVVVPIGPRVTE